MTDAYLHELYRFLSKCDRNTQNGCWQWLGGICVDGYARWCTRSKSQVAHKWLFERLVSPVPFNKVLDHLCRNRSCVNPQHLECVSQKVNVLRGVGVAAQNAAKTLCPKGHEFDVLNYQGRRQCLVCRREYDARWKRNHRRAKVGGLNV